MAWRVKTFKTKEAMDRWIMRLGHLYQTQEVFINNGYALDIRRLRVIG